MALYNPDAKTGKYEYAKYAAGSSLASKDSLIHTLGTNRDFMITDVIIANTNSAAVANVQIRYAAKASSASASTSLRVMVAKSETFRHSFTTPLRIPYGSGNKIYLYSGTGSAKVTATITGYEEGA
jgi:hypothetical protein